LISTPSGLFEPTVRKATRCKATRSAKASGTATRMESAELVPERLR
jgi:hypothetical protein